MSDESATAVADPVDSLPSGNVPAAQLESSAPAVSEPVQQWDFADPSDESPAETTPPKAAREPKVRKPTNRLPKISTNLPAKPLPAKQPEPVAADPGDEAIADARADDEESDDTATADKAPADIDDSLFRQAEAHGISREEAAEFGDAKSLEKVLTALDRRAAAQFREQPAPEKQPEPVAEKKPDAKPTPTQPVKPPTDTGIEKYKLALDPDVYDEDTIKVLGGFNDHVHGIAQKQAAVIQNLQSRLDQFEQHVAGVTGRFAQEDHARFTEDMDGFFDGLSDEFKPIFGKGKAVDLAPSSNEMKSRASLVGEMNALRLADQQLKRTSPIADLRARALRVLHSDRILAEARSKLTKAVDERRGQAVSRPSARVTAPKTAEEAAARFARNYYREHGADQDERIPDEL